MVQNCVQSQRKTVDQYQLLVNRGLGWEIEKIGKSWEEIRRKEKDFRKTSHFPTKTKKARLKLETDA